MVNPENAVNFINIATQVTATLLGFGIFAYFFWYENVGKQIEVEITQRLKGFRIFRRDGKFHKKIIMNKKPLFMRFKKITKIFGSHIIYNYFKDKWVKYQFTQANSKFYYRAFIVGLFFTIIMFGAGILIYNISILYRTSQFTNDQLTNDPLFSTVLNTIQENFEAFIAGFLIIFMIIVIETIGYEFKKKKIERKCMAITKAGKRCSRLVKNSDKYCYQHKKEVDKK